MEYGAFSVRYLPNSACIFPQIMLPSVVKGGWRPEISNFCQDPSAEFASTEVAEVSRFLARPGDFTYAVTEVTSEGQVRHADMCSCTRIESLPILLTPLLQHAIVKKLHSFNFQTSTLYTMFFPLISRSFFCITVQKKWGHPTLPWSPFHCCQVPWPSPVVSS